MKSIIVLTVLVAAALAAPTDRDAVITAQELDNIGVGSFRSSYSTSNGIKGEAQGELLYPGTENEGVAVRGSYSYIGDDGQTYAVNYIADQNGFQPQGAHIPQ